MDSSLISVIVPVYQAEEYLDACVQSLLRQTCGNIEILLIDDGSTDASSRMCDAYAGQDPRVRAVHQKNRGLSGARNTGLRLAAGEYIAFVDADDCVSPVYIERLYGLVRGYGADIAACGYTRDMDGLDMDGSADGRCACLTSGQMLREWHGKRKRLETVVWNKLYHRSILRMEKDAAVFPERKLHEDVYVSHLLAAGAGRIAITEQKLYMYRRRGGSLTTAKITRETAAQNLAAQTERLEFFEKRGLRAARRRLAAGLFLHWLMFEWKLRGRAVDRKRELLKYLFHAMI